MSRDLFDMFVGNPRDGLIIADFAVQGTLARSVLDSPKEVLTRDGHKVLPFFCLSCTSNKVLPFELCIRCGIVCLERGTVFQASKQKRTCLVEHYILSSNHLPPVATIINEAYNTKFRSVFTSGN